MSKIEIFQKNKDKQEYSYHSEKIQKIGEKHLCFSEISKDFILDTIEYSEYLIVHTYNSSIRGFAYLTFYNKPKRNLYVDLICNTRFHNMKTRSNKNRIQYSGKNMIQKILELGKKVKVKYIELSAIKSVINYYYNLGFRFKNNFKVDKTLLDNLRKAQLEKNTKEINKNLNKIITKYYSGFYNEQKQYKFAMDTSDKKKAAIEDGISMIYDYGYHRGDSICKSVSIKNPNRCKNYKECTIARGTKRSYCRKLKNKTKKNR